MPQVWKMPTNSQRKPDFVRVPDEPDRFEPAKAERARQFCFSQQFVGIGWGVERLKDGCVDHDLYLTDLERIASQRGYSLVDARGSSKAFALDMKEGDFVWCRAKGNIYWLGKVCGSWKYADSQEFGDLDFYQVRDCKWIKVGTSDLIPGPVRNAFAGPGMTICRIRPNDPNAHYESSLIWSDETGDHFEEPVNFQGDLANIGHDDLEDIVGLYLQMELGWYIIPSTAKRASPLTEFILRNCEGKRAYLQIKSGNARFEHENVEIPEGVDRFFVFYPTLLEITD
jgi:hypothetical protein